MEIFKYLELNDNENITFQNLQDAVKFRLDKASGRQRRGAVESAEYSNEITNKDSMWWISRAQKTVHWTGS